METRVFTNLLYYKTNYLFISVLVFLWALFSNWRLGFSTALLLCLWAYVIGARKAPLRVGQHHVSRTELYTTLVILSGSLLWLTGSFLLLLAVVALSGALALLHAVLRPRNTLSKLNKLGSDIRMATGLAGGGGGETSEEALSAELASMGDVVAALLGKPRLRPAKGGRSTASASTRSRVAGGGDVSGSSDVEGMASPRGVTQATPMYAGSNRSSGGGGSSSSGSGFYRGSGVQNATSAATVTSPFGLQPFDATPGPEGFAPVDLSGDTRTEGLYNRKHSEPAAMHADSLPRPGNKNKPRSNMD